MPEDQKAGTQTGAPDGGDDAAKDALTGTQDAAADGGDAGNAESADAELAKLREEKKQWLAEKSHLEELKRAEAARAAAAPTVTPPNVDAYAMQRAQQMQQAIANTQLLAQQGDPLAQLIQQLDQYYANETRNLHLEVEAMKVPESYRDDVRVALKTGHYANAQAALKAVKAEKDIPARESEIERLKRENESLRRAEEARKAGVVGAGRPVPDLSGKRGAEPRNEDEFVKELDRLEREGDFKTRTELSRRYRNGELPYQRAG